MPDERAAPAGMGGTDNARLAIAEEDGSAIGGEHADGKARRGGDHGIGLGRALHIPGALATAAFALCDWKSVSSRSGAVPKASATRARFSFTSAALSREPSPQLREA